MTQPNWWTTEHNNAWDRVKDALKRDWEQTKADFTSGGRELGQDAGDTVKQALGTQPIPSLMTTTPDADEWGRIEHGYRFGVGARHYYKDTEWNDELEGKLNNEWTELKAPSVWEDVKTAIKRGWERGKLV